MTGQKNTGFWNVQVHEAGRYVIRLRRWPEEADLPISVAIPPGISVPGAKAYRTTPGVAIAPIQASLSIANIEVEKQVNPGDKEVVFELDLPAGKTQMTGLFHSKNGQTHGAYYAYVSKED